MASKVLSVVLLGADVFHEIVKQHLGAIGQGHGAKTLAIFFHFHDLISGMILRHVHVHLAGNHAGGQGIALTFNECPVAIFIKFNHTAIAQFYLIIVLEFTFFLGGFHYWGIREIGSAPAHDVVMAAAQITMMSFLFMTEDLKKFYIVGKYTKKMK